MKRFLAAVLALAICFSSVITATAAADGVWKQNAKGWWYEYADGTYQKGWATIDGNRYYFDTNNGYATTGWKEINGKWYLFDSKSCAMLTGWQQVGSDWYYLHKNGEMLTGWQKTDTVFSYLTPDGVWVKDTAYKSDYIFGIDVSKWQGTIDWQALKDEGVKFAFVRVGHGDHVIDPKFDANMKAAEKVGIPVGVYFYSTAQNETEALRDAQFVIDNLDGYLVSYPVAIDIEDASQASLSKTTLGNIVKVFSNEIAAAGYTPMLYCNENWYKNHIDTSLVPNVYKWIARYNAVYDTAIKRDIWQSGSSCRINGISGNVDIDFASTDFSKIVTPRRQKAASYQRKNGAWRQDSTGWWYEYTSGGWAVGWELIGRNWYYFDKNGYMCTGWVNDGKAWFWLEESGAWSGHQKDDITDPAVHENLLPVAEIPATCITKGTAAHFKCEVCGRLFSDSEGVVEITAADTVISITEHTFIHFDAVSADCYNQGNIAYDQCQVCQKIFANGFITSIDNVITPMTHTVEHFSRVEPQIGKDGVEAHEKCTLCNRLLKGGRVVTFEELIIPALPAYKVGWNSNSKGWWYVEADGNYVTGWKQIKGVWYHFDTNGWMQTNWQKIKNIWYYFDKSGAMVTSWQKIGGVWYYFNSSGAMQIGWLKQGSKWYYLNSSGAMVTGTVKIGGKTYKFNSSGVWIA